MDPVRPGFVIVESTTPAMVEFVVDVYSESSIESVLLSVLLLCGYRRPAFQGHVVKPDFTQHDLPAMARNTLSVTTERPEVQFLVLKTTSFQCKACRPAQSGGSFERPRRLAAAGATPPHVAHATRGGIIYYLFGNTYSLVAF